MSGAPYAALGALIAEARKAAGLSKQADLATALKITQQTVSRWEAGDSRPRATQITALAVLLKLDASLLMERAGYAAPAVISFDQPFPVDQLPADAFEQFVHHLVSRKYAGKARVRRVGGAGHTQDGVDIVAHLTDGSEHVFQCKRHKQFGPADVAKAVAAYTGNARKHLVLARVASPQAADAARHAGWVMWDKDDLSRIIRSDLSMDDQLQLVDIFFRGQRQALLGRPEPGPWMTPDDFFRPFEGRAKAFNHDHALLGREREIEQLISALDDRETPVVTLTAAGGMGKSRLLKEALRIFAAAHPAVAVRMLAREADPTPQSLADLGKGPQLLVIDDAHERDGLAGLFHYAASTPHTRILISTRPYAQARIEQEAAVVSLPIAKPITLARLPKAASIELAREILQEAGADPSFADSIVEHVGDNPLVTLMAARIIGAEKLPLEAAKNADVLRRTILGKFQDVIIGDLGGTGDEEKVKAMLHVLALVQPFHIEDSALTDLLEKLRGIDKTEASRLMKLLLDGGLIYKRGAQFRLMPDLLGDYIIERSCIGPTGKLSPFAEKAFEAVQSKHLENLLLNLARMDWRLSGGDPAKSPLLDGIWRRLRDVEGDYDPRTEAITAVAIYQPRQALAFVEHHIRQGTKITELPAILRAIAFNYDYLDAVCAALWELGKDNPEKDGYRFESPISVLEKLCGFEEKKPLEYCERVFDFAMALSKKPEEWKFLHSPLDIMLPVLSTEGMSTSSNRHSVTFKPFLINYDAVKPLREKLIERMLELLEDDNVRIAYRAADAMQAALRGPWGLMRQDIPKSVRDRYEAEFEQTIEALSARIRGGKLAAPVLLALAKRVVWLAEHGPTKPKKAAKALLSLLPDTLEFRLLATLAKGNGSDITGHEFDDGYEERDAAWLAALTRDLKETYDREELLDVLETSLRTLKDAGVEQIQAWVLVNDLLRDDAELARALIKAARSDPDARLRNHLAQALYVILEAAPGEGQGIAEQFLDSADDDLAWATGAAFGGLRRKLDKTDRAILKRVLSSPKPGIVQAGLRSLMTLRFEEDPRVIIDLAKAVHIDAAPNLADDIFTIFRGRSGIMNVLTHEDVLHFLTRLKAVSAVDGYHTQDFLAHVSKHFPFDLIDFFLARIEIAVEREDYSFRSANAGPYVHVQLRFQESADPDAVLARVWTWLNQSRERKGYIFYEETANLFEALFPSLSEEPRRGRSSLAQRSPDLARFFESKLDTADRGELLLMARLLRKAGERFAFVQRPFVVRFLDRCKAVDRELLESAIDNLYTATRSGSWGGKVGEPFPRDISMRDESMKILATLPRFSAAYEFYEMLRDRAEKAIAERSPAAEELDDE